MKINEKKNYYTYYIEYKDKTTDEVFVKKDDYEMFVICLSKDKLFICYDFKLREMSINFNEVKKVIKLN